MNQQVVQNRVRLCAVIAVLLIGNLVQAQDADLVDKVGSPDGVPRKVVGVEYLPRPSASEQKILDALNANTETIAMRDIDLTTALNYLKDQHGFEFWIDSMRIVPDDIKVTLEASNLSVRASLNLMLEPHNLAYMIEDDVLKITTQEIADNKFITRTYPIADLCDSPEDAEELIAVLQCGLGLINQEGLPPAMSISRKTRNLIVRHTHQIHTQLLNLLRDMRELSATPSTPSLVLNIGFERDPMGNRKGTSPVIIVNEESVDLEHLQKQLQQQAREMQKKHGDAAKSTAVVIRADREVPYKSVQQLIKECQECGFTKISLHQIADD